METKRPEIIIIARDWTPGEAVQIVLVRPSEIVLTAGGGIDLAATPSTGVTLMPAGWASAGQAQRENEL